MRRVEDELHAAIVQHLRRTAAPDVLFFHPANEGSGSVQRGAKLKRMGVVAGCPDLCFTLADGRSAFMEVKAPKGSLSPEQRVWRERCEAIGSPYAVVKDIDTALSQLRAWGVLRSAA